MNRSKPQYLRVKEDILQKIHDGIYHKDDRLPSENALCDQWKLSRMTVRRALDELTREGVLYRTRGSGTFVSGNKFSQQDMMNFSAMVRQNGSVPSTEVLEKSFICEEAVAEAMHLPESTVFYVFSRLRLADGVPVGIEKVYLPLQYCERPDRLDLSASLYDGLKNLYGWIVARQDLAISARNPSKEERELMKLGKDEAVLVSQGISLDADGHALLFEKNLYAGASYTMRVSISGRRMEG